MIVLLAALVACVVAGPNMRIVNAMRRAGGAPPVLMGRSEIKGKHSSSWASTF